MEGGPGTKGPAKAFEDPEWRDGGGKASRRKEVPWTERVKPL